MPAGFAPAGIFFSVRQVQRRMRFLAAAVLLLSTTTAAAQEIALRQIASGLDMPVALTHANDSRLFVTLQRGQVVIYDGTRILPTPFLDIRSLVRCCDERGLLSVAFHPRYGENGIFFVYYTDAQGDIVIARYEVSSDPNRADPASGSIVLEISHPTFGNHNGGQLAFGPDGFLYIGTGDGGGGGDPSNNAMNLQSLLGKLLRIDVDGGSPYGVPSSNPFVGRSDARREIWAIGLRNPWRFSFDRETGDLWIADVGQGSWEEIDFQPRSSIGGENYGWRRMEGTHCFNPSTNCNQSGLVLPVIEYNHSGGACSVTGGHRYRGSRFPRLAGSYIYGDYCNGVIWGAVPRTNGTWNPRELFNATFEISSFGEDVNGEIYVVDHGGRIFQIEDLFPQRRRAVRR